MSSERTLSEKVWERHVVHRADGEPDLLYIDLHLVHEVTSPQAFDGLRLAGRGVRRPDLTLATMDHNVPTTGLDKPLEDPISARQMEVLAANCAEFGIELYPMGDRRQGIVHVIGPEQGLTQPGMTIVCGDSHTSTHGAFGALAFGIGTSEVEHVLATQTLPQQPSQDHGRRRRRATCPAGVTAKDVILAVIGRIGTGGGIGSRHRVPRLGVPRPVDGRPHDRVQHEHRGGRPGRPGRRRTTRRSPTSRASPTRRTGAAWERALDDWRSLVTDDGAAFDKEVELDAAALQPHVTWGTNPGQVVPIDAAGPGPRRLRRARSDGRRRPAPSPTWV